MHQIKSSGTNGYVLQRPFTCNFCLFCEKDDYDKCVKKQYTEGLFKKQKLPIKTGNVNNDYGDDNYSSDDNDDLMVGNFFDEDSEQVITVTREELKLVNVTVGDFVVVALPTEKEGEYTHWVYRITRIVNEEAIFGSAYKSSFDSDTFYKTNESEQDFDLNQIMMILPEPIETRSRFIFPDHIDLQKNLKLDL